MGNFTGFLSTTQEVSRAAKLREGKAYYQLNDLVVAYDEKKYYENKYDDFQIFYHGELYNREQLCDELHLMESLVSDEEIILFGYQQMGCTIIEHLNGVYAIGIHDTAKKELFLFRDRLGVKSIFYSVVENGLVFSGRIKGILAFPEIEPIVDATGLCELLGLGPARTNGTGVFKNILEVRPGHYLSYKDNQVKEIKYWDIETKSHEDTYEETVEKVSYLVKQSIIQQSKNQSQVCSLLSGGLDSSVITAFLSKNLMKKVHTVSFDYEENDKYFKSSQFQPDQDRPWVLKMIEEFHTDHEFLFCNNASLYEKLFDAVDAKDLPGMADVDSSFLYFSELVAKKHPIAFSGECSDELFAGYPWFHRKELYEANTFPWSKDISMRTFIFNEALLKQIKMEDYIQEKYQGLQSEVVYLPEEGEEAKQKRSIAYLTIKSFMPTLVYRLEKVAEASGLNIRTPFADYKIAQYLYNVPWEMKCPKGVVKGLLRDAFQGVLPDELLYRKKSPFPKTYHPLYEQLLKTALEGILNDKEAPVLALLNVENVKLFLDNPVDYGKPWFGQLMASPQMMAYIIQLNDWMKKYRVRVVL